jgi:hypothetical protein
LRLPSTSTKGCCSSSKYFFRSSVFKILFIHCNQKRKLKYLTSSNSLAVGRNCGSLKIERSYFSIHAKQLLPRQLISQNLLLQTFVKKILGSMRKIFRYWWV